jgi:hypothetical protein
MSVVPVVFLEDVWGFRFEYHQSQAYLNFSNFVNVCISQDLTFPKKASSTDASRVWTLVFTCRSWFLSDKWWDVNWVSKQSAITLAFSFGLYVVLKGPWIAVGVFGSSLFISDFAIGHWAWGVTSHFPNFACHGIQRSPNFEESLVTVYVNILICSYNIKLHKTNI